MKVLLHICCAVCATSCVERLRQEGHEVSGYFYNPNIHPQAEYIKRLSESESLAKKLKFPFYAGKYDTEPWFKLTAGLEAQPEGGARCSVCFKERLEESQKFAQENSFDGFATTLSVSPHKNSKLINEIGKDVAGSFFLSRDFKKADGFKRALEMAKEHEIYRQNYCGCIFSRRSS